MHVAHSYNLFLKMELDKLKEDKNNLYDKNNDLQEEIKELKNQNSDYIQHLEDKYKMESRFTLSLDEENETCWKENVNNGSSQFTQDYSQYMEVKLEYDQDNSGFHTQDKLDYG